MENPSGLKARARSHLVAGRGAQAIAEFALLPRESFDVQTWLDLAVARRLVGDISGSLGALDEALALEPRHSFALLSKGALFERLGRARQAAMVYGKALASIEGQPAIPQSLSAPVARAREVVARQSRELAQFLRERLAPLRANIGGGDFGRFEECLDIYSGLARPYVQQPLLLTFPRLPAIPFLDRSHFAWLEALEAATPVFQADLESALSRGGDWLEPYIDYPPGTPVNQWAELNHSPRWSSFFLWRDGVRQSGACELCPGAAEALKTLPMANQPGFAPTAMFSILDAHTRIPPHTGSSNTRLIVHLPLRLPGPAGFRVGNVTRRWRIGEAWVFDDTIEHEAWNDADEARAILIFDVWNPLLTEAERELVSAMMAAKNVYMAQE